MQSDRLGTVASMQFRDHHWVRQELGTEVGKWAETRAFETIHIAHHA